MPSLVADMMIPKGHVAAKALMSPNRTTIIMFLRDKIPSPAPRGAGMTVEWEGETCRRGERIVFGAAPLAAARKKNAAGVDSIPMPAWRVDPSRTGSRISLEETGE